MDQMLSWSGAGPPNHIKPLLAVSSVGSLEKLLTTLSGQKIQFFASRWRMCLSWQTRLEGWFYRLMCVQNSMKKQTCWWEQLILTHIHTHSSAKTCQPSAWYWAGLLRAAKQLPPAEAWTQGLWGGPVESGNRTLETDALGPEGCKVEPPWIWLDPANCADASLYWDLGSLRGTLAPWALCNDVLQAWQFLGMWWCALSCWGTSLPSENTASIRGFSCSAAVRRWLMPVKVVVLLLWLFG